MNISENLLARPVQALYHSAYNSVVVIRSDNTREFIYIDKNIITKNSKVIIHEITILNSDIHYEYGLYPFDTDTKIPNDTLVYIISDICNVKKNINDFYLTFSDNNQIINYAKVHINYLNIDIL